MYDAVVALDHSPCVMRMRSVGAEGVIKGAEEGKVSSHSMPESANALCRIVSFTAANTRRMFDVSVACVRLDISSSSAAALLQLSATNTTESFLKRNTY